MYNQKKIETHQDSGYFIRLKMDEQLNKRRMKDSTAYQRFKKVREELKMTQNQFAEKLDWSASIADIERGKTRISGKLTMRLLQQFHINPLWLFGESETQYLNPDPTDVLPKAITINESGKENILLVNSKASAGYGNNLEDPEYLHQLPAFGMPLADFQHASFRGFQIQGDSMFPLVDSGDWVLAKAVESVEDIHKDRVYIIVEKEGIRLKKVYRIPEKDRLELISLNPEYTPVEIPLSQVQEIWEYHSKISIGTEHLNRLTLEDVYKEIQDLKKQMKSY